MAIPSSPPILPADLLPPSSPALPALPTIISKKRRYDSYDSLSSDPLFSEETSDAELCERKAKKQVRGPWWALRRHGIKSRRDKLQKRSIQVNDSGVWMHSDEDIRSDRTTDLSSDAEISSPRAQLFKHVTKSPRTSASVESMVLSSIQGALEDGQEVIDLDCAGLTNLTDTMLRPLHQMVRAPQQKGQYRSLTPQMQLYLASNQLEHLPSELFRLTNITVLSLRNNNLQHIPPAMSKLVKLRELNLSGNQIQYLPWEFMSMLRSSHITYRPNPLYTIDSEYLHTDLQARFARVRQTALREQQAGAGYLYVFLGASRITYHSIAGKSMARSSTPAHAIVQDDLQGPASTIAAPSLFELALRQTQKAHALKEVITVLAELPQDEVPETILEALQAAAKGQATGNDVCSTCGREMILSRAEWVEYWSRTTLDEKHLTQDCLLPLLKRACTPACAVPTSQGTFHQ